MGHLYLTVSAITRDDDGMYLFFLPTFNPT